MIPLMKTAFLREEETKRALADFIISAPRLSMDSKCREFEQEFAAFQGRKHAVLFNSGGSANLAMLQAPLGKSGVSGKGLMSISVNKTTKFPNASLALAQFFTNPRSMVAFSKIVSIYPSSPKAFEDPFFSTPSGLIEDSARPLAGSIIATYADIVPTIPKKADVNDLVLKAIESALFNNVPAQQALSDAVKAANALIK